MLYSRFCEIPLINQIDGEMNLDILEKVKKEFKQEYNRWNITFDFNKFAQKEEEKENIFLWNILFWQYTFLFGMKIPIGDNFFRLHVEYIYDESMMMTQKKILTCFFENKDEDYSEDIDQLCFLMIFIFDNKYQIVKVPPKCEMSKEQFIDDAMKHFKKRGFYYGYGVIKNLCGSNTREQIEEIKQHINLSDVSDCNSENDHKYEELILLFNSMFSFETKVKTLRSVCMSNCCMKHNVNNHFLPNHIRDEIRDNIIKRRCHE